MVTNWPLIVSRLRAGEKYAFGTFSRLEAGWFARFKAEAPEHGLVVDVVDDIVWLSLQ